MLLLITGGCGSGKSWIAQGFSKEISKDEPTVILDCVAELLSDRMEEFQASESVIDEVIEDIRRLRRQTENLIVVTNEVFSDVPHKGKKQKFVELMGRINQILVRDADIFVEVVYGIPIWRKQLSK